MDSRFSSGRHEGEPGVDVLALGEALIERYAAAFASFDIDTMMELWAVTTPTAGAEVTCIHPSSARASVGLAAVMESWLLVFSRSLNIKVVRKLLTAQIVGDGFHPSAASLQSITPQKTQEVAGDAATASALIVLHFEEEIFRPGDVEPAGSMMVTQAWQQSPCDEPTGDASNSDPDASGTSARGACGVSSSHNDLGEICANKALSAELARNFRLLLHHASRGRVPQRTEPDNGLIRSSARIH
ncbi:MAG: YybH family protein [Thioalkalivibrionaceae bacterium]